MARILTGIQSTGVPHLGNILGAIGPAISMSKAPGNDAFLFIADLHSFTAMRDPQVLRENTYAVAAAWLACGLSGCTQMYYRVQADKEVKYLVTQKSNDARWQYNSFTIGMDPRSRYFD